MYDVTSIYMSKLILNFMNAIMTVPNYETSQMFYVTRNIIEKTQRVL